MAFNSLGLVSSVKDMLEIMARLLRRLVCARKLVASQ